MLRRINTIFLKDPLWSKLLVLSVTLFFVYFADAILSFWIPGFIQKSLKSAIAMGFVISFSSIVALGADLALPQLLRGITVRRLIIFAIFTGLFFSVLLLAAVSYPIVLVFLTGMVLWGLFYEFLGFASYQFVADTIPINLRSSSWAIIGIFKSLAFFLGPLFAGWLLIRGDRMLPLMAIFFTLIGLLILTASGKKQERPLEFDLREISFFKELEYWATLFSRIWPVITMSLVVGCIEVFFWTTGTIYSEKLSHLSWLGGLFLPLYILPSLFMGFMMARWHIYKGKKKIAQKLILISGLFLAGLAFSDNILWILLMVFMSSLMQAIACPLLQGVYSDVVSRMGRVKRHMIGLTNSTISLAYVIGPIIAGVITSAVGEKMTFVTIGVVTVFISGILLLTTPKKLKLPQEKIKAWEL